MTYDDSYIEHWGEFYRARAQLQRYCTFEQFLARPRYYVENVGRAPLLDQLAVRRRLDTAHSALRTQHSELRNGRAA